ncbi:hypothetical protein [Geodermatophilus sp. SYSU D00696]
MSDGTDWVEQARRLVAGIGLDGLGRAGADTLGAGHVADGDCRWCPVCQLAAVARRPEVSEALADALTSAAAALRAFAAAAAEAPDPEPAARPEDTAPPEDAAPPRPAAPREPSAPPVQHIEIG